MTTLPSTAEAGPWRLAYFPALDGLRAVAVSLVFITHAIYEPFLAGGSVGVTAFFTLSGFLITSLLLQEVQRSGTVAFRRFYVRRARRLLPAMYVATFAIVAFELVVRRPVELKTVGLVLVYLGNLPVIVDLPVGFLAHMWSLAVEEQFYLVWPVVLWFVYRWTRSKKALAAVLVVGIVGSATLRFALWDGGAGEERVYLGSDTRADALLIGCLLAVAMHDRAVRGAPPRLAAAITGVCLASFVALGFTSGWWFFVGVSTIVPWLTIALIWAVATQPRIPLLTWAPLVRLGQRSYGFYLWHLPIVSVVARAVPNRILEVPWIVWFVLTAAISWGVTVLSWRFVERPFLEAAQRRRRELPSTQPEPVA